MKIHRLLNHVCLHLIDCFCNCCYAETSSSAVQKRHSKVYGKPIASSLYSILLACTRNPFGIWALELRLEQRLYLLVYNCVKYTCGTVPEQQIAGFTLFSNIFCFIII